MMLKIKRRYLGVACVVLAVIALVLVGLNARHSSSNAALPIPPHQKQWKLVFEDNFDGEHLDTSKWVTCYDWYDKTHDGCSNNGNNEEEWYTPAGVSLGNGVVTLTAKKEPTKGWDGKQEKDYGYKSGMISTGRPDWDGAPKWTATYGYYEARVKMPEGRGIWPAFWLLPADKEWPPEIDIMELLGHEPSSVLLTYFWANGKFPPPKDSSTYTNTDQNFTSDWHVFAVDWQPGKIDWYVDGTVRKTVTSEHVPNEPMEILLNLAVGGKLPGTTDQNTVFPAQMQIDYVRVYQHH